MLLLTMTIQVDMDHVGRCEAILRLGGLKKWHKMTGTATATLLAPLEWSSSLEHIHFH